MAEPRGQEMAERLGFNKITLLAGQPTILGRSGAIFTIFSVADIEVRTLPGLTAPEDPDDFRSFLLKDHEPLRSHGPLWVQSVSNQTLFFKEEGTAYR